MNNNSYYFGTRAGFSYTPMYDTIPHTLITHSWHEFTVKPDLLYSRTHGD